MADPRAAVKYDGIAPRFVTFKIDNSTIVYLSTVNGGGSGVGGQLTVGLAVGLVPGSNDTIQLVSDAQRVLGKLVRVNSDNFAVVQVGGAMLLPQGTGAACTVGNAIIGSLSTALKGFIRLAAIATLAEVGAQVGIVTNIADATNIAVLIA